MQLSLLVFIFLARAGSSVRHAKIGASTVEIGGDAQVSEVAGKDVAAKMEIEAEKETEADEDVEKLAAEAETEAEESTEAAEAEKETEADEDVEELAAEAETEAEESIEAEEEAKRPAMENKAEYVWILGKNGYWTTKNLKCGDLLEDGKQLTNHALIRAAYNQILDVTCSFIPPGRCTGESVQKKWKCGKKVEVNGESKWKEKMGKYGKNGKWYKGEGHLLTQQYRLMTQSLYKMETMARCCTGPKEPCAKTAGSSFEFNYDRDCKNLQKWEQLFSKTDPQSLKWYQRGTAEGEAQEECQAKLSKAIVQEEELKKVGKKIVFIVQVAGWCTGWITSIYCKDEYIEGYSGIEAAYQAKQTEAESQSPEVKAKQLQAAKTERDNKVRQIQYTKVVQMLQPFDFEAFGTAGCAEIPGL